MLSRCLTLISLMVLVSIYSGCAGTPPLREETMLDKSWGRSFERAKYNQILNPEAGKNLDPCVGLDGQAADTTVEQYRKEFKGKAPKKTYNLNLGTISGIGEK